MTQIVIEPIVDCLGAAPFRKLCHEWHAALEESYPVGHVEANGLECPEVPDAGKAFDAVAWESGPLAIRDESGRLIFEEPVAEFPTSWGTHARTIVAQKYFYGDHSQGFRETSLRQLIARVSYRIAIWAARLRTFRHRADAESFLGNLIFIQLKQMFAFNSPVYFNVGVDIYNPVPARENFAWDEARGEVVPCENAHDRPQVSACFIQSVQDNMQSIMELATSEAMLFKRGSGTGTDLTPLRSSREWLSGGGHPSGPLSFMKVYDSIAGVVKSGGRSRRAAKMQTLKYWHPDILEFIDAKSAEERKARALIAAGYEANFNGEAYASVLYQNCNTSVRVTDLFMYRATEPEMCDPHYQTVAVTTGQPVDTLSAADVLRRIAAATHFCGDPGLHFEDVTQAFHTVPKHGPINSTNPCSEYTHVDDSACNLASYNLMRFVEVDEAGEFRRFRCDRFEAVIRIGTIAMETLVDSGSYPTAKIARNSHRLRPLGGGFANPGTLAMVAGLAYDSDAARDLIGGIAALLTAQVYGTSSDLSRRFGPFAEFAENREDMLSVMRKHASFARALAARVDGHDGSFAHPGTRAAQVWSKVVAAGEVQGFRNSQATCIAPTGTIGFMMGCDTLGVEPDIALVRYKSLAGRGVLKLVNGSVGPALARMGYIGSKVGSILSHINKFGTIQDVDLEGHGVVRSGLNPDHLPIFDCAFPPRDGTYEGRPFRVIAHIPTIAQDGPGLEASMQYGGRSIAPMGHVRMMAACTPFVSGAISKTVNLPEDSTVDDIFNTYVEAWRMGCKAIAIYRDNSKGFQPVTTRAPVAVGSNGQPVAPTPAPAIEPGPRRERLPDTRRSLTHKFTIAGHEGYVTVGFYPDSNRPGEVFLEMSKSGSTVGGLMDSIGMLMSLCLQYGVPTEKLIGKLSGQKFEPSGITTYRDIPFARSIIDYVARWLGCELIPGYRERMAPLRSDDRTPAAAFGPGSLDETIAPALPDGSSRTDPALDVFAAEIDGNPCPACGMIMVRQGRCELCFHCGHSAGGCG